MNWKLDPDPFIRGPCVWSLPCTPVNHDDLGNGFGPSIMRSDLLNRSEGRCLRMHGRGRERPAWDLKLILNPIIGLQVVTGATCHHQERHEKLIKQTLTLYSLKVQLSLYNHLSLCVLSKSHGGSAAPKIAPATEPVSNQNQMHHQLRPLFLCSNSNLVFTYSQ
ncbi:unnamed protein product [Vicia faba]|uniref:Uncharacterized protein n=1 Tax=Vicia faba TaxID=3906 RepID=A0AAV0Z5J0_VICFA|nr:unnamed protein product [Vicia faba]